MSATFNEISTKLSSKNPIVIIRKNINILLSATLLENQTKAYVT